MCRGGWRENPGGRSCAKGLRQKVQLREEVVKCFVAGSRGTAEGLGSIESGWRIDSTLRTFFPSYR